MRSIKRAAAAGVLVLASAVLGQSSPGQSSPGAMPRRLPATPALPAPVSPSVQPRFVVVIDAAHGGADSGAKLQNHILEKDINLSLGERLRSLLRARGIEVVMTREADVDVPALNRAEIANHAEAAACLLLHATATGSGVHLFTTALAQTDAQRVEPWETAQAAYSTQSLKLEAEIDSAFAHAQVPVTLGRASVQPMDNLICPAVAVEVAPLVGGHVTGGRPVTDPAYQISIVDALAAALEQWRSDWKQ